MNKSIFVFSALLLVFLFPQVVLASDTYPYPTTTTCATSCQADPWGFYKRECTSYAAWKVNESGITFSNTMTGPNSNSGLFGNGGNWDNNATYIGFTVDTSPSAGDIAVWDPNLGCSGSVGHVGIVDSVSGSTVYVSEYNWNPIYVYNTRSFTNGSGCSATKYIDVGSTGPTCPSGSDITLTTVVNSGVNFTCTASSSITLNPGFHAKSGSTVNLYIQ